MKRARYRYVSGQNSDFPMCPSDSCMHVLLQSPQLPQSISMAQSSGTFSETAKAGSAYDQYRPTYSATIVQTLLENLGLDGRRGAKVLDLAAGTGKFTEVLAARDEQFEIVAVEPQDDMRQVLADKKLARVTVERGTADSIPLEDSAVDAVICAQVGRILLCFLSIQ